MALGVTALSNGAHQFEQGFCVSEENLCANCMNMQDQMQVLSTELKSAELIIKLLQDELQSKVTVSTTTENVPTCVNSKPDVINNSVSSSESEWTELRRKNLKAKLPNNNIRCLKQTIPHIPPGYNRFEPLSNLREDTYQPTYNQPAQSLNINGKNKGKLFFWATVTYVAVLKSWQIS